MKGVPLLKLTTGSQAALMGIILLDAEQKLGALLLPSPSASNTYLCLQ